MTDAKIAVLPSQEPRPLAIIYLRVSTKDQATRGGQAEGFSIPAQRDACLRKAQSLGAVVVEEFVDRGESARSADRPELQRLLRFVREHSVSYAIVHKVDRLARNRVDDVEINLVLSRAGVQLVSCSENIDETPSGMLLHGIMSSIAEFYSRNLATESRKGMRQKARSGGTPGMAPFGYINTRVRTPEGREVRTVEVDPDRADIVRWLYKAYASGEWTLVQLRDQLERRGVTALPRPNKPAKPLSKSNIDSILKNRYYVGAVTFEGVEFPGKHEPLIPESLWQRAQNVRQGRFQSGEKPRQRPHYLKGSLYCGQCGDIMGIEVVRNSQGVSYPYFYCLGRQKRKNGCIQRAVMIDVAEEAVESYWRTVTLPEAERDEVRSLVWAHLNEVLPRRDRAVERAKRALSKLDEQTEKLLQAHYNDAIPMALLKKEQARIAVERAAAEKALADSQASREQVDDNLRRALALLDDAHGQYLGASRVVRRLMNQAIFVQLWLVEDEIVGADFTPAYRRLLADDLAGEIAAEATREQTARSRTNDLLMTTVEDQEERTEPTNVTYLSDYVRRERPRGRMRWETKNPGPLQGRGSNPCLLVAGAGFEPATSGL
jgi:site-specific DNA recombinase